MSTVADVRLPVSLEVPVDHKPTRVLGETLLNRINCQREPLTPEAIQEDSARREALRGVALAEVKERAKRDLQHAVDAAERKERAAASEASRILSKLHSAAERVEAKKQERLQKVQAQKEKRSALAQAVTNKRSAQYVGMLKKGVADAERGEQAVRKSEARLADISQRGAAEVEHALSVVASKKAKEELVAKLTYERLQDRLEQAEARREESNATDAAAAAIRARQAAAKRQEKAIELEQKRLTDEAQMEKVTAKRELLISTISESARVFNMHAAEIAEAIRAHSNGADELTAKAKAAIYEKLVAADVARGMALRSKTQASATRSQSFHPEVIVVKTAESGTPVKAPPAELLRRLTTCPQKLLASASARQLGALARREAKEAKMHQASVSRVARVAAAQQRRALRHAEMVAKMRSRDIRSKITLKMNESRQIDVLAKQAALADMVYANREAAEQHVEAKAVEIEMKAEAAKERREAVLRKQARVGVVAVRQSAFKSRRNVIAAIIKKNAELHQTRCVQAETSRLAELGAKVFVAKESAMPHASRFEAVE